MAPVPVGADKGCFDLHPRELCNIFPTRHIFIWKYSLSVVHSKTEQLRHFQVCIVVEPPFRDGGRQDSKLEDRQNFG